jgi:anti-anti-sigma factor
VDEAIFYKETDDSIFVKARGHITAAFCSDLKKRTFERIEKEAPIKAIVIDLSECSYMDSTFMGLIVGFKKMLSRHPETAVTLVRPDPVCMGLLKSIGLTRLVAISDQSLDLPPYMENIAGKEAATAEFLLDAHENLMEISDENKARFSVLSKVLKDQIGKANGEKQP